MKCMKCGADNEEGTVFCVSCGKKLKKVAAKSSSDSSSESSSIPCPECGAKNPEDALSCSLCGNVLKNMSDESDIKREAPEYSSPADNFGSYEEPLAAKAGKPGNPFVLIGIIILVLAFLGYIFYSVSGAGIGEVVFKQPVSEIVKGNLVSSTGGEVTTANIDSQDYVLVYFSAHWCPPCKMFTPSLAKFYKENKKANNFEILFVSFDRSEMDMFKYMAQMMPWPGVRYQSSAARKLQEGLAGKAIPCLVMLDNDGKLISHSFDGSTYLGPHKVLNDLRTKLKGN